MLVAPRPWSALGPGTADVLRPGLPDAVDAAIAAIDRELPLFRGRLDGELGRNIRRGVQVALDRFLDLLGTDAPALDARSEQVYAAFGEGEGSHGRSMDTLLGAYRIGARVTWGSFAAAAIRAGITTGDLVVLAEAIFAYIDEISAASAVGYARQQAAQAGQRNARRARLAEVLLTGTAVPDVAELRRLAAGAAWSLPATVAVAVVPLSGAAERTPVTVPDALVLESEQELLAVVPDPVGRLDQVAVGLGGTPVFLGTLRPPEQAQVSLAHAREVHRLVAAGTVRGGSLVLAGEHLPELVLGADPALVAELSGPVLAPLADLPPGRRAVLERTLAAWLAHQGDRGAVARALQVHPQTVSYRMARLADLVGARLADPRGRLELTLALSAGPGGAAWRRG
jgi:hypothetical protein